MTTTDNGPAGDLAAIMNAARCDADRASWILAALIQPKNGERMLITRAEYESLERVAEAAKAFRDECQCPAPDLLERARLRTALFATLDVRPPNPGEPPCTP